MIRRSMLSGFFVAGLLVFAGCNHAQTSKTADTPKDFTVEISGTKGLVVDLLVILKPDDNSIIKAVNEQVTIPYKQQFTGTKKAVWVDSPYRGQEGEYTLRIGGSTDSCNVKQGVKGGACLYDL